MEEKGQQLSYPEVAARESGRRAHRRQKVQHEVLCARAGRFVLLVNKLGTLLKASIESGARNDRGRRRKGARAKQA